MCPKKVKQHGDPNLTVAYSNASGTAENETSSSNSRLRTDEFTDATSISLGYILVCVAALMEVVFVFTVNRKLKKAEPFALLFWVGASGVIVSLIGMGLFEKQMLPSHMECQLLLAGHAFSASMVSSLGIVSNLLIAPEIYSLIYNLQLVYLFVAQYTVLKTVNPGHRNVTEILGAAVVFAGNCLTPIYSLFMAAKDKESKTGQEEKGENKEGAQRERERVPLD